MSQNKQTIVGEVDSINGNIISVRLDDNIKSTMPVIDGVVYRVGQIGSFLKIPLGYACLYGIVTQIGAAAIPDNLKELLLQDYNKIKNTGYLSIVLVGEQVGKKFERGVTQFPATSDKVHLVTINDLDIIYGGFQDSNSIIVGNISVSESLNAKVELDKLVSRHCAIVGSTGSGKSNSVAIILEAIAQKGYKSSRILIIDPHGEYNETLQKYSKVYKINVDKSKRENELFIPFWALPFNELISIFSGNLSDQQRDYIQSKIVDKKKETVKNLTLGVKEEAITADNPIPFSLNQLWFELDDFERQTYEERGDPSKLSKILTKGDPEKLSSNIYEPAGLGSSKPFLNNQAKGILRFLDSLRTKLLDSSYNFLFNPGELRPDLKGNCKRDLDELLGEWLCDENPITILDLSGVPGEIMSSISGTLLKIIYDALFWGQNTPVGGRQQPLLIVLEEAHSYLKAGDNSISSRIVQTIAKEGRKYGVGLLLVTQRPSELDETVLSQCGTMIALRMNNSKDRNHIAS